MSVEERATVNPSQYAEDHIQAYLASNGQDVDHPAGDSLILLYTTGRTSGKIRRAPLGSFPDGENLVVIGSNAGRPKEPEWYLNLVASHRVWVRKQDDFYEAEASVLPLEQRQVFWDNLTAQMPMFADYQKKAGRELPLIRLTRTNG
jgi:deazaflavin-dependent oxidoreductase (nitroreductase family)